MEAEEYMEKGLELKIIGHVRTDFTSKFGIPRQSGLIEELKGTIVMEPEYREPAAFKAAGRLVADGPAAAARRKQACRSVCHPFSFPSKCAGTFLRKAGTD